MWLWQSCFGKIKHYLWQAEVVVFCAKIATFVSVPCQTQETSVCQNDRQNQQGKGELFVIFLEDHWKEGGCGRRCLDSHQCPLKGGSDRLDLNFLL